MLEGHLIAQPRASREILAHSAVFLAEVEDSDSTAQLMRKRAGCTAQATPHIENMHSPLKSGEAREVHRRLLPPNVEVIHRRKVARSECVQVFTGRAQAGENASADVSSALVGVQRSVVWGFAHSCSSRQGLLLPVDIQPNLLLPVGDGNIPFGRGNDDGL